MTRLGHHDITERAAGATSLGLLNRVSHDTILERGAGTQPVSAFVGQAADGIGDGMARLFGVGAPAPSAPKPPESGSIGSLIRGGPGLDMA